MIVGEKVNSKEREGDYRNQQYIPLVLLMSGTGEQCPQAGPGLQGGADHQGQYQHEQGQ